MVARRILISLAAFVVTALVGAGCSAPTEDLTRNETGAPSESSSGAEGPAASEDADSTDGARPGTADQNSAEEAAGELDDANAQQLVDAARDALQADVERQGRDTGLRAFGYIDADYQADDGVIVVQLCGWDGAAVANQRYESTFRDVGDGLVAHVETVAIGTACLTADFVEVAIELIDARDEFWHEVAGNPAVFPGDFRVNLLYTQNGRRVDRAAAKQLADAGETLLARSGSIRRDVIDDLQWRFAEVDGVPVFEIAACRRMSDGYGVYVDDELVDDRRGDATGDHEMTIYSMVVPDQGAGRLKIEAFETQIYVDCFEGDRLFALNADAWKPAAEPFRPVPG